METIVSTTTSDYLDNIVAETTSSDLSTATYSPTLLTAADLLSDHHDSHQITFEVPSHSDLERIRHLDSFRSLMRRLGHTAYETSHEQPISSEQLAKSAVVDLSDLQSAAGGFERFFHGADVHSIINYLWIGVVTALVVLSVIFILFSVYFYRKFRQWQKCNKDIRANMHSDLYAGDTLLATHRAGDSSCFQKEAPPCYTIATGLPTYDEALHHQHHCKHPRFALGLKLLYPELAAAQHPFFAATSAKHDFAIKSSGDSHRPRRTPSPQRHQQQQQPSKAAEFVANAVFAAPPAYSAANDAGCCRIDLSAAAATTSLVASNVDSSSNVDEAAVPVAVVVVT